MQAVGQIGDRSQARHATAAYAVASASPDADAAKHPTPKAETWEGTNGDSSVQLEPEPPIAAAVVPPALAGSVAARPLLLAGTDKKAGRAIETGAPIRVMLWTGHSGTWKLCCMGPVFAKVRWQARA